MSGFTAIDLSKLPAPDVVEQLDYELVLAALKADLIARLPELDDVLALESEPLAKLMEISAYRETVIRARVNDAARAVMLAYAAGADLDQLGALVGVARLTLVAADPLAIPPVAAVMESDAAFRVRIQLAPEAYTVAGSRGSYIWHALSADADVLDASVWAPESEGNLVGEIRIAVLSRTGDGTPEQAVLDAVAAAVSAEDVRPLTDRVYVQAAEIVPYTVEATLTTYEGPDSALVLAAAQSAVEATVAALHRLGHDVARSALMAALHAAGVQRVELTAPADDLVIEQHEASYCSGITLTHGGTDL